MKAVNLIPAEAARGRGSSASVGTYALLAVLALLVVMASAYTLSNRAVGAKETELAQVTAQAADAEARAGDLKSYTEFANMRKARIETIEGLIASRFGWADAMHEVARTLPAGTWVTSLRASASPDASVEGASDSLRGALAVPAIELAGCAKTQQSVARTITSLRRMSGVQRVSLSASEKEDGAGSGDSASSEGCRGQAKFSLTVFFEALAASKTTSTTAAASGGTTP